MTRGRALAALALAAALAAPAPLRAQMPDPRQMSGIPRPDAQVDVGTATVRVIHGDMTRNVGKGQPVHLIALRPGGVVERITQPTDDQGRATFAGLAADGSTTYYALALVGEDRLESQLMTLDKMAGLRLMLAARKLDEAGQPVGEPVDDIMGDEPAQAQPPGEVLVLIGGSDVKTGTEVQLVEVPTPGQPPRVVATVASEALDQGQVARYKGVAAGPDVVYVARVTRGGKVFNSRPFMMRAGAGAPRSILVIEQVIVTAHIAGELDDEVLRMQVQYQLNNFSGGPIDPGQGGLLLPLPPGSQGGSLSDESGRVKIEPGKHIIWRGPLAPGANEVIAAFSMPIDDGRVSFAMPAPTGLFQSSLVIERAGDAAMTAAIEKRPADGGAPSTQPLQAVPRQADNGRWFFVVGQLNLRPDEALTFEISGLPRHPASQRAARIATGVLVLFLVALALFVTIFDPRRKSTGKAAGAPRSAEAAARRRKELTAQREKLYDELVSLEKQRAAEQIDDGVYATTRTAVVSKLTLVLRELDQLDGGAPRAS